MRGVEPPRPCGHKNLNLARLPIPPHPQATESQWDTPPLYANRPVAFKGLPAMDAHFDSSVPASAYQSMAGENSVC